MKRIMAFLLSIMIVAGSVFSTPAVTKAYQVPSNLKWWANDRFGMLSIWEHIHPMEKVNGS